MLFRSDIGTCEQNMKKYGRTTCVEPFCCGLALKPADSCDLFLFFPLQLFHNPKAISCMPACANSQMHGPTRVRTDSFLNFVHISHLA